MSTPEMTARLVDAGVDNWLINALHRIARNEDRSLEPYLVDVGETQMLDDTRANCRCHFVRLDGNDRPRIAALIEMLVDQVVDYCIPRSRIDEAMDHMVRTGSTAKVVQLQREAKALFTTLQLSGEGGELLLYTLLEIALGVPQILCKMSLKTNANVHYHGVDGVHAQALEDGRLAIYWGEAKLYGNAHAAIDAALSSLAPFLLDAGGGAAQRDVLLLRDHADTGDERLNAALIRYFTDNTMEASQLVVRGACLIGFSHDDYARPHEADGQIRGEVLEALGGWQTRVGNGITNERLESFELELFLVPMPSVDEFREGLKAQLGLDA
jgi:hypothetical protein